MLAHRLQARGRRLDGRRRGVPRKTEEREATEEIASVKEDRVPHVEPEPEVSYSATLPPKRTSSA